MLVSKVLKKDSTLVFLKGCCLTHEIPLLERLWQNCTSTSRAPLHRTSPVINRNNNLLGEYGMSQRY